jgi:uncharacterized protein YceK
MRKLLLVVLACIAVSGCASAPPAPTAANDPCKDNVSRFNCFQPIM